MRDKRRDQLLEEVLEACRVETLRRLKEAGLPTTVQVALVKVEDQEGGWRSDYEVVTANALHDSSIMLAIRDDDVPALFSGLSEQFDPLANHLVETTDLESLPHPFMPADTGSSAIKARFLSSMVHRYLVSLDDLESPDHNLIATVRDELDELCDEGGRYYLREVALAGVLPSSKLFHRGVSLRPLTPYERGAALGMAAPPTRVPGSEFVPPMRLEHFAPTALLSVATVQPRNVGLGRDDDGMLPHRVALAFHLKDYELASPEMISAFHMPRWSSLGQSGQPFPLEKGHGGQDREITQTQFGEIIDLALRMPPFSGEEGSRQEIVLFRALRGLGASYVDSAFLDLAIALEAALLGGSQTELAYKFRMYGALFLRHERSPHETFDELKQIYEVRSKLVHGMRVTSGDRRVASERARGLVKAIVLRSLKSGWPDPAALDQVALYAP